MTEIKIIGTGTHRYMDSALSRFSEYTPTKSSGRHIGMLKLLTFKGPRLFEIY